MINRRARIRALEKFYKPSVLANFRFVTFVEVAPDDPWCGMHIDVPSSHIGELIVYASTRKDYEAQRDALRRQFTLLEG